MARRTTTMKFGTDRGEAAIVGWSEIGPPEIGAKVPFMRLTPGLTHTVRLFHRPVRFWVRREGRGTAIISEVEALTLGAAATRHYAINVIDRADRQIKVLEGPENLFIEFRRCQELTSVELGGPDGFDFGIDVVGVGVATVYRVSYDAQRPTPFIEEEKDAFKNRRYDLTTIFARSRRQVEWDGTHSLGNSTIET